MRRASIASSVLIVASFLLSCAGSPPAATSPPAKVQPAKLRVALFPYIPDAGKDGYEALRKFVESEFERAHPQIELIVRKLDPKEDFYDPGFLGPLLQPGAPDGYDLIEVDTVILGDLVGAGWLAPWSPNIDARDWHPAAAQSVRLNETIYGIPHWLCGHFLMTRDRAAARARNVGELEAALASRPDVEPEVIGDLLGSWNMPSLYLDAWQDGHPHESPGIALHTPADRDSLEAFKRFVSLCRSSADNPCLSGTYDDDSEGKAAREFAEGKADALVGYSERLFFVLSAVPDDAEVQIVPAPLGNGRSPLLFTDAFVMRRGLDAATQRAAQLFTAFMSSPQMQEALTMSRDAGPGAVPRYLIPATDRAFSAPGLRRDRFYRSLRVSLRGARPFPNVGFMNTRKALRDEILTYLKEP